MTGHEAPTTIFYFKIFTENSYVQPDMRTIALDNLLKSREII